MDFQESNLGPELHKTLSHLYYEGPAKYKQLVTIADNAWEQITLNPTPFHAEACRLAMLGHYGQGYFEQGYVWRMRSVRIATACSWPNTVCMIILSEASRVCELGARFSHTHALQILEEFDALVDFCRSDMPFLQPLWLRGIYWEMKGYLQQQDRRQPAAIESYTKALTFTESDVDPRRWLRVRAGLSNSLYLAAEGNPAQVQLAIDETSAIRERLMELGRPAGVLAERVAVNLEQMTKLSSVLLPYEIL